MHSQLLLGIPPRKHTETSVYTGYDKTNTSLQCLNFVTLFADLLQNKTKQDNDYVPHVTDVHYTVRERWKLQYHLFQENLKP
jgi:hypothetical protein